MAKTATKPKAAAPAETEVNYVPVHALSLSPLNVRQADPAGIAELADNIDEFGVLQNLTVVPAGTGDKFEVIAGGRRLQALQLLVEAGRRPANYSVPCLIVHADKATALSLAENQQREALHPVDEAEAFARLVTVDKKKPKDIAAIYGVSVRYVQQRLKLAAVAHEVKRACRRGDLSIEQLAAFTVVDDREKHRALLDEMDQPDAWDPDEIRERLSEELIDASNNLVEFIGLDAYRAAGGQFAEDLFAESDDADALVLRDYQLVRRLANEKLQELVPAVEAEGWKWVAVNAGGMLPGMSVSVFESTRNPTEAEAAELQALNAEADAINESETVTDEQDARLREIEQRIDAIEAGLEDYNPREKALTGALVTLTWNGKPNVMRGIVRTEDAAALEALQEELNAADIAARAAQRGEAMQEGAKRRVDAAEPPMAPAYQIATLKAHQAATRARCHLARKAIDDISEQIAASNFFDVKFKLASETLAKVGEILDEVLLEA